MEKVDIILELLKEEFGYLLEPLVVKLVSGVPMEKCDTCYDPEFESHRCNGGILKTCKDCSKSICPEHYIQDEIDGRKDIMCKDCRYDNDYRRSKNKFTKCGVCKGWVFTDFPTDEKCMENHLIPCTKCKKIVCEGLVSEKSIRKKGVARNEFSKYVGKVCSECGPSSDEEWDSW